MKKDKYIIAPDNCSGCGLCANVCPKDSIRLAKSSRGFYQPVVDVTSCINCGLCSQKCPAQNQTICNTISTNVTTYGAWLKDDSLRALSSSGGVFTSIAKLVLADAGIVYGVIWGNDNTVSFSKAECEEELAAMRGSKYVQAQTGYVFRAVKEQLKLGRKVLFSGVPCQVNALNKFLAKSYENLITIDIFCYGAPSPLLLTKYVQYSELIYGKKLKKVFFRDKSQGSTAGRHIIRVFEDDSRVVRSHAEDYYIRSFFSNLFLINSCYSCQFSSLPRVGDISIGDFWGVDDYHPDWPKGNGVSAVVVNTDKGKEVISSLSSCSITLIPTKLEYVFTNKQRKKSFEIPEDRDNALKDLAQLSINEVWFNIQERSKMKAMKHYKRCKLRYWKLKLVAALTWGGMKARLNAKKSKLKEDMRNLKSIALRCESYKNLSK